MTDPREIIARTNVDVFGEAGEKAAAAILSALDEAGYGVYRVTKFTTPLGGTINYPHIEQMEAASPGYTERRNAMKKESRG